MRKSTQSKTKFAINFSYSNLLFGIIGLACLHPKFSSPVALLAGLLLSLTGMVPQSGKITHLSTKLLGYSIIGLGFGVHLKEAIAISQNGIGLILTSISVTLLLGWFISRRLGIDKKTGHLIASGTAICGGSAIAAVAPSIKANSQQISVALATVFTLNALALFIFPGIGHYLNLSQQEFGTWCAIAIHDTSSVVGAASVYGDEALKLATSLKLSRALWIVPIAFLSSLLFKSKEKKLRIPWFIGFYCLSLLLADLFPQPQQLYSSIFFLSKRVMVFCLFLIGSDISIQKLKATGPTPLLLGVILWIVVASGTLAWIIS
jgi:uncharacterized integral membrane protein (TIGR00698 family)